MKVSCNSLHGSCGTWYISSFGDAWGQNVKGLNLKYGSSVALANFVNEKPSKMVYEHLASRYNIIFQDKPRYNENSGRDGFLCIFDTSSRKDK